MYNTLLHITSYPQLFSLISLPNWKQFKKDNGAQKEATIVEEEFKQVCWNSECA
jgi:hypothetical protein